MSAKPRNDKSPPQIGEVLRAFFQLDARVQQEVQEEVKQLDDPQTSAAERAGVENKLAALLRSAGKPGGAGRLLSREERLGPELQELQAQMDQREAAFVATLARLMAERQLTQAQLAERLGVSQPAIAMLLKRRCRPQRRTLGKLAEALEVTVEELWPGFSSGWRSGLM